MASLIRNKPWTKIIRGVFVKLFCCCFGGLGGGGGGGGGVTLVVTSMLHTYLDPDKLSVHCHVLIKENLNSEVCAMQTISTYHS